MTSTIDRIGTLILTGFLGSGKTTFLNRLLSSPYGRAAAVIVNEFGEIGLDHALIETFDQNMIMLDSGCVCCTVRDSLSVTLEDLELKRAKGLLPRFDRVIIETTGLADPGPILRLLISDPMVAGRYAVEAVTATVDSVLGQSTLERQPEAVRQVALADLILLTKTDIADPDMIAGLRVHIGRINSAATIIEVGHGDVRQVSAFSAAAPACLNRLIASACGNAHEENGDHGHAHLDDVYTCTIRGGAISWGQYMALVNQLQAVGNGDLLRVKAVLDIEGHDRPVTLHGVQGLIHSPGFAAAWPTGQRESVVVVIARGSVGKAVRAMIEQIVSPA